MRGEVWVARAELYASKVRPVLVAQASAFDVYDSTVTCLLTTFESENALARVRVEPDEVNGLDAVSFVMTKKLFSFDKADLSHRVGRLSEADMARVSDRLRAVLDL
ncbi:MAG: type II toxin-antitoxin system PemK/MazF family toxin [Bifidobacteriaceae bacterium]|jgi:mRNA interferase MazF|nr:type II toxin-antitoxin system PemK/MazF family toxin [Bifidobacteriaceae bacterium]